MDNFLDYKNCRAGKEVKVVEDLSGRDAFSRLRVSNPTSVFDCQFTYNLQPLLFEQLTNGSGASISHDSTNSNALMTFSSTPTGGYAYMQSYEHNRYQPGKGGLVFITFNFVEEVNDVVKFVGYSNGINGFELWQSGSTLSLNVLSPSDSGNQSVTKSSWNIDTMDGFGPSKKVLDLTKTQILVLDFQALYVGAVRVGFDIDGVIYYVHKFNHANLIENPYISNANLPIRVGMSTTATVSTTMNFICCSVSSEGGQTELAGYGFAAEGIATAGNGVRTHILSVRPKTLFNSISNRSRFVFDSIDLLVTGTSPVKWELVIGQAISGTTTFNDVNATYSSTEFNTAGTVSGNPAIVIESGYVAASNQSRGSVKARVPFNYPITPNAAGAVRLLGTLSVLVTGIGAASTCRATLNWREIR